MPTEHVDVLIVGAGLSGVCAAHYVGSSFPDRSYLVLEQRDAIGGTWDLFRYPGIRSDSDMYTLGYAFRPWKDPKAIADGPSILSYVRETAAANGIDRRIRLGHRVVRAEWSSSEARWTVHAEHAGGRVAFTCGFLFGCTGYYRYEHGYTPEFAGMDRFGGRVVHPQQWPADLDYAGERVVVIGSGATAVTLVPAMARTAAHVTMLQRSPTYIVSLPAEDPLVALLRRALPLRVVYVMARLKNALLMQGTFQVSRRWPRLVRAVIRRAVRRHLPPGYDVDTHFNPPYDPWDQRMCLVPDGDLFETIRGGRASIVTDRIETFTESGIRLESGGELEADLVVTATGLDVVPLGNVQLVVDGDEVALPETLTYKGMMLSDVPNLAVALGYTNASWTLKAELTCRYVVRLLAHMYDGGHRICVPRVRVPVEPEPVIDLKAGYVLRAVERFPKQGSRAPWRLRQNYVLDLLALRCAPVENPELEFSFGSRPAALAAGSDGSIRSNL